MILTPSQHTQIEAAITSAELRTKAEILCMVSKQASQYRFTPVLWASVIALIAPWPLWWFTQIEVSRIFLIQIILFCGLLFIFSHQKIRIWLTPKGIRRADVECAASHQFNLTGVAGTKQRMGVLLYISVAERIAIVLPDEAIAHVLTLDVSQAALKAMTSKLKNNQLTEAFLSAISVLVESLSVALPAESTKTNELPNTVIEG